MAFDIKSILFNLPEVKHPAEKKLGFNVKLKWTLIILSAFFILENIPLHGLSNNNCKIIEAITIGPIPKEIIEPKSVPRIIARYSNLAKELFDKPCKGIFANMKKAAKIIKVHLSFTLKPSFFSAG